MEQPFLKALPIIKTIENSGYEAYFVGGSVRDYLINRTVHDVDIATSAPPHVVQNLFKKTIPVGIEHGTILVRHGQESYEVTTFRIDGKYEDFRHPDEVTFVTDLKEDLARRDFTMNAIAMDQKGQIHDPFHGQADLKSGYIRTVGKAEERFYEDPLRMMRAVRFVSQLGFQLDDEIKNAMKQMANLLEHIAVERITVEIEKLFMGEYIMKALTHINETNIGRHLPIFRDDQSLIKKIKEYVQTPFQSIAEAITFFHILNPDHSIQKWIKSWKLSNKVLNSAKHLHQAYLTYQHEGIGNETVYVVGKHVLQEFAHLVNIVEKAEMVSVHRLEKIYEALPIRQREDLCLNGHDILALAKGRKPGPWVQELLLDMERQVVRGSLKNETSVLKEWVKKWITDENS
ncbi:CCA tRNA nucleotidyltransferase [Salirhabdus salicampi]|uniref:CCA tRNA nucleotidyltransferase n=1 Tax=Salirhabdus salicampi TaxID=476102 RepID=UPI0020C49960|nr:CCA tRNA nucleotidyltransferase [Salirhabdus salicampi]MCP8616678.1 CCA tRNA nucleotidyltransferase [Salirhabdus salicampi]